MTDRKRLPSAELSPVFVWHLLKRQVASEDSSKSIRRWAKRLEARKEQMRDVPVTAGAPARPFHQTATGRFGICRYRELPLRLQPDGTAEEAGKLQFAHCYRIEERLPGWLRVVSEPEKQSGWIPKDRHFGITQGEFKILKLRGPSAALTFLINALSYERSEAA